MGFFNTLRNFFWSGPKLQKQATQPTLKTYTANDPYSNMGSYYKNLEKFNSSPNPKSTNPTTKM